MLSAGKHNNASKGEKQTKMKSTKSALLMSFTSLLLCFAMLIGSTFAWFTDSVTSGVNKIVSGNLDIEVSYKNGDEWESIAGAESLFNPNALWEPGHTEYVNLKVENKGTLALKYQMNVSPVSESGGINVAGESFKLSDYLMFGVAASTETGFANREAARAAVSDATKLNAITKSGTMEKGATAQYVTLVVYMPEDVGNVANYKTGTAAPFINLGITVLATQQTAESDSFGNTYDTDATNDTSVVYNYFPQVTQVAQLKKSGTGSTAEPGGDNDPQVKAADNKITITSAAKVGEGNDAPVAASVTFGNDAVTFSEGDTATVTLDVKKVNEPTANITVTDTQEAVAFDVKVTITGADFAKTGDNFTSPMEVTMFIGKGKTNLKLYHGNTAMTKTDTKAADTFTYDPATGVVTMYVNHFSEFTAVYDEPVAAIGTTAYYSLETAIAAAKTGETVTLLKDVTENVTVPTGMTLTLNLNGKTLNGGTVANSPALTNNGTLTVTGNGTIKREDTGTEAYYVVDNQGTLTFKNGTVTNASGSTTAHAGATLIRNGEVTSGALLSIEDGTFSQPSFNVIKGGGNSEVNISGGTISCGQKYAVLTYGNLTITGGSVTGPISVVGYKDANEDSTGVATISGGTINSAITVRQYTGYHATTKPSLTISGGTFGANTSFAIGDGKSDTELAADTACGAISITGGTFSSDPSEYVKSGYEAVDNENGTWGIVKQAVCNKEVSYVMKDDGVYKIEACSTHPTSQDENKETKIGGFVIGEGTVAVKNGDGNYVVTSNTLQQEVDSIANGATKEILLLSGTHTVTGGVSGSNFKLIGLSNEQGNKLATIDNATGTTNYKTLYAATASFDNVSFLGRSADANPDASKACGFAHNGSITYLNCTFEGSNTFFCYEGGHQTFADCVFNTNLDGYSAWTYGTGLFTFERCTFNTAGKGIKAYSNSHNTELEVVNCDFHASAAKKAAIELDIQGNDTATFTATITDCSIDGCFTKTYHFRDICKKPVIVNEVSCPANAEG